jgi:hypothetical protein
MTNHPYQARPGVLELRSHSHDPPRNIDITTVTSASMSSLSLADLPSPRAGEVPPALSPLDQLALQGRLLAKRFEQQDKTGRRLSRLAPLTIQNEFGNRAGYFSSLSSTVNSPEDEAGPISLPKLEASPRQHVSEKHRSVYPQLGGDEPPFSQPPSSRTPLDTARGLPVRPAATSTSPARTRPTRWSPGLAACARRRPSAPTCPRRTRSCTSARGGSRRRTRSRAHGPGAIFCRHPPRARSARRLRPQASALCLEMAAPTSRTCPSVARTIPFATTATCRPAPACRGLTLPSRLPPAPPCRARLLYRRTTLPPGLSSRVLPTTSRGPSVGKAPGLLSICGLRWTAPRDSIPRRAST